MGIMNLKAQNRIFKSMCFSKLLALILTICIMSCVTAYAEDVSYIDENGNPKNVDATVITGDKTYFNEGWYVVKGNISFNQTIRFASDSDVRIILADGAAMIISPDNSGLGITTDYSSYGSYGNYGESSNNSCLYIYGQSGNTGTLSINTNSSGMDLFSFTQNGGTININAGSYGISAASKVNINGGTLNIKSGHEESIYTGWDSGGMIYRGNITIKGGKVSADKKFYAGPSYPSIGARGTITLGLTSGDNGYIRAKAYEAATVNIADSQILIVSGDTSYTQYSGCLEDDQIKAIAGQTLVRDSNYYSYVDENGEVKYIHATPMEMIYGTTELLGGWYIVNKDITIGDGNNTYMGGSTAFEISYGTVNIILADGKTLTVGSEQMPFYLVFSGSSNLNIYGQEKQTGTLKIKANYPISVGSAFTQNGGNIILDASGKSDKTSCGIYAQDAVNINNGTLSIDVKGENNPNAIRVGYMQSSSSITISGGKVKVNGADLYAGSQTTSGSYLGTITLGYRNETDCISADAYTAGTVKVASGQILMVSGDTTKLYSGDITASKGEIAGKTLVPYEAHTISYDYGLNDGESLLNEGYLMLVSLNESVDVLSLQLGSNEAENMIQIDQRSYFTLLSSSDVLASTLILKATYNSATSFIFEPDYPEEALEVGTHEIAVNSSTTKGTYRISALSAGMLNPKAYAPSALPMMILNPARKGYTFSGWTASPSATLTQKDGYYELSGATENLTLKANWTLNTYTIKYVDADMSDTTYTVLDDTFTLNRPTKDGYMFVGWTGTGLDGAVKTVTIPTGSTGNRTYTAAWQKSFTPDDKDKPEIHQHAMILGSQIVVMFYVYLPDSYTPAKCTMAFDVSGDKTENPNPTVYYEAVSDDKYTLYGYRCYVNSIQMADTIHAVLYDKDDNVVLTEDYKAKTYLDRVIASDDVFSSYTVNLCKAIKNYGSYVQIPLAAENGWTIGKEHAKMDYAYDYAADDFLLAKQGVSDYAVSKDSNAPSFNYALYLDSKTTLEVRFDSKITDIACASGDVKNNIVTIADISAHELGNKYTITGKNSGQTFTVEISPLSYVKSVLNDESEVVTGIKNGVISLYDYYYRTMRYRTKHQAK